jgi:hypothetical protein
MTQTRYDGDLERLNRQAELLQEEIGLLQRLREIDLERQGGSGPATVKTTTTTAAAVAQTDAPKRRGRPAKVKAGISTDDGKSIDLPTLLVSLAQNVNKPLLLADFVTLAREAGYTTKAKDFSNMVYQAVLKLVKKGLFKKNDETRAYEFVKAAA